jgi:trk system potassium uptake protein TrkA
VGVVAIGENLEANIVAAMNLKLIGVPTIWAKAQSRTHHRILSRIGVDRVVQPEHDTGIHVSHTLHSPFLRDYMPLGNGYSIVNIEVPDRFDGQAYWVGLVRGESYSPFVELDTEDFLRRGDKLLFVGRPEVLRRLAASL